MHRAIPMSSSPLSEFLAGCRAIVPLVIGSVPFGIIFGTLAANSELSFVGAMAMSLFVFAGSAQFIAIGLLATGTLFPLIIFTTFVVNLRHLLYSVSVVPYLNQVSQTWKLPLGFLLTDEVFAVTIDRYNQKDPSPYKHWYHLGASLLMYLNWQLCTLIGLTIGNRIHEAEKWGLDFAMAVTFIGMIIPYLKNRPMVATVVVAGIVSLLTHSLPHQIGLIIAALAGIATGTFLEQFNVK